MRNGWVDLLQMMENGEIDLMGAISYTEEHAQKMLFPELPMGREKYYLYHHRNAAQPPFGDQRCVLH